MEDFEIRVGSDFIRVQLEEVWGFFHTTSYEGGYSALGSVEIACDHYRAQGDVWFSTGEVWQFYTDLLKAYTDLEGSAVFAPGERLSLKVTFTRRGYCTVEGMFQERLDKNTRLTFVIECDQSYLTEPLAQLAAIVAHYGDMRGVAQE